MERLNFSKAIELSSKRSKSRIIVALDIDFRQDSSSLANDAKHIVRETKDYACAYKFNFHLIAPLSLNELRSINELISGFEIPSIADIKLNDIDNTNRVATEYLWQAGFSAVIANPLVGLEGGLDTVLSRARELGKGVILLAYMSHKGAVDGYGLRLSNGRTLHELFLDRALEWKADGVIVGSTRPEIIRLARSRLQKEIKIFSPGSGAQGGDPLKALESGSDYLIFGRNIIASADPKRAASEIHRSLLPWIEGRS